MYLNLNNEQNKSLFIDAMFELLTKRQDVLEIVINNILQRKAEQEQVSNDVMLSKKQLARAYFEKLHLDFSGYQFNREQANER